MAVAPTFHQKYTHKEAPDCLGFIPSRTLAASTTEGITFPLVPEWVVIWNLGTTDLRWGLTDAAVAGSVYDVIAGGESMSIPVVTSLRQIKIRNDGLASVDYKIVMKYTDRPFPTGVPDVTVANGFVEFDDSDTSNIQPGIE